MSIESPAEVEPGEAWARSLAAFGATESSVAAFLNYSSGEGRFHVRGSAIDEPPQGAPHVVATGWACHVRTGRNGRRQLISLVVPGDMLGSFWPRSDSRVYDVRALTRVHTIHTAQLLSLSQDEVSLDATLVEAARRIEDNVQHLLVEHILRLSTRDAYAGLTHLLLEIYYRLHRAGLAQSGRFALPVGQRVLAKLMGLSLAHTNLTLQRMRADGLYETQDDIVRLLDIVGMERLSDFRLYARDVPVPSSVTTPPPAQARRSVRHDHPPDSSCATLRTVLQ